LNLFIKNKPVVWDKQQAVMMDYSLFIHKSHSTSLFKTIVKPTPGKFRFK